MRTLGVIFTVALGWALLAFPMGVPLLPWSYDFLQLFLPAYRGNDVVIVHMDQQAIQDYQQKPGQPWPRSVHARLLDRLSRDRAKVVVFDVTLTESQDPAGDTALAEAIRRNGKVVLAGDRVPVPGFQLSYTLVPPLAQFATNAANWGIAKVMLDPDRGGRRYDAGNDQEPGLDWAAASVAGASVTRDPERRWKESRWLNYYGSGRPFETASMTYTNAETRELGFFKDKAVFIGGKPETLLRGEDTDVFATPFTRWNSTFIPGVEIAAIAYANLVHEEWLHRLSLPTECGILLLLGCLVGFAHQRTSLRKAVWLSLALGILFLATTIGALLSFKIWFPWAIVCFVQLPGALLLRSLLPARVGGHRPAERVVEEIDKAHPAPLEIPDHTLIRRIGEGAYGQVWIARNAIGLYHAVKIVYRNRFATDAPYERAFRGIQKFMPVSRSHEGFVHMLHVGRNDAAGAFFYIMEVGDDQSSGQRIDPATYVPKTLASELKQREALPPVECLELILNLVESVERLHQHQLIHRDIKPANIIFVNGRPKLADIDLVTDLVSPGEASRIGTEGYIAPEGPGTAAADVFSLGRILYVALTAKAPDQSPELPTRVGSLSDPGLVLDLNQISSKASDGDLSRRYPSAARMHADLFEILRRRQAGPSS